MFVLDTHAANRCEIQLTAIKGAVWSLDFHNAQVCEELQKYEHFSWALKASGAELDLYRLCAEVSLFSFDQSSGIFCVCFSFML